MVEAGGFEPPSEKGATLNVSSVTPTPKEKATTLNNLRGWGTPSRQALIAPTLNFIPQTQKMGVYRLCRLRLNRRRWQTP